MMSSRERPEAVAADPSCSPAADLAVRLLLKAGRPDDAMGILRERSAQEEGNRRAETLFRMAEIAEHVLRDPAGAAALYGEAATTHGNHPFAAVSAANALAAAERDGRTRPSAYTVLADSARDGDQALCLWHAAAIHEGPLQKTLMRPGWLHERAIDASALQPASVDALIRSSAQGADPRAQCCGAQPRLPEAAQRQGPRSLGLPCRPRPRRPRG